MEVAHVHTMTLIRRSLLIEPVPVASTHAAQEILLLPFCQNHKASCTTRSGTSLREVQSTRTLRLVALLICLLPLRSRRGAQPQRDVGRLHRLPYHTYQITA
jgi:hypothetical protein